ncbi:MULTISPECIES: hypothetical protein [Roseomonadaceae]|uniref:SPOR domain-containing protein n=1 Tax=Falsiroseomonas oleicola TaxID=2801474 RepID=A0ABS6H983_9PROT|nr:hypothetical protein [Roseomonas oleicola]MBU8543880.1 hypothetical protein [Roseomonas oleicola]
MAFAMRALGLLTLLLMAPMAQAQDNPLVQRGVPAEATAETAVLAREQALNAGQRLAYERMAAALGMSTSASAAQIDSMVRSLIIESERISARTYTARITVNFNPQRVAAAGGRLPANPDAPPGASTGSSTETSPGGGPETPVAAAATGPAVATVEALASYRGFAEWVEITRRLSAAGPVARVDVVSVAGDQARLRLGLRSQPAQAAMDLAATGLMMSPTLIDRRMAAPGPPPAPSAGEGWRLSLAGTR